ncbi:NADPH-dependent methylglyoxal reductase GRE2 [Colletotrichum spaethianum]|uniref:NADPH-dependent methylglyoxal reductase GRE2 n=1 Tax=Colletotrichum spaethianum TaxID=700344 RepID=A0AA37P7W4_9PEZI|nr:NADPH-dependent methylglyoxal reductase GRE2 [Colletotrichum spaethianum]GKT46024.1 NADPH-dependent methylglyoxal reductase GRE2 [Colletotrichum spaethianum]
MASSTSQTIVITGANGYLALHVINQLLEKGYSVRGTVRSPKADEKVRATFPNQYGTRLTTVFVEDLTKPELFRDAFDDNTVGALHLASPVHGHVEDNVRDMLDPAVKGATSILDASKLYAGPAFRRVVHLSSIAAMLDDKKGLRPGYTYTDSDWNPVTFEEAVALKDHAPLYIASKGLSERAVWAWMAEHKPKFDLACVNPTMVIGPHLEAIDSLDEVTSTAKFLWQLVDATEIPPLPWAGCVDVRDTAAMTVAAFEKPEAGGQRLLLAHHFDWQTATDIAREELPEEVRGRFPMGRPGTGRSEALEHIYQLDGSKAAKVLGVEYRPLSESVKETLEQFLAAE